MELKVEIPAEWREEIKREIMDDLKRQMEEFSAAEDVLRVSDVAELLKVSEWSVYQMIRNNDDFPVVHVGSKTRVLRSELLDWLKEKRFAKISEFDGERLNAV